MKVQKSKPFKDQFPWLKIYKPHPSQTIKHSRFHYFSHDVEGYQKITLMAKYPGGKKKKMKMYYEIDNSTPMIEVPKDTSQIRDFNYIDFKEPQTQCIVVNGDNLVNESQWIKKYEPHRFIDLLTDQKSNRQLLAWLKSWDPVVFNKNHHKKLQTLPIFPSPKKNFGKFGNFNKFNNKNQESLTRDRLILLAGPPGCGKTTLVRVLAKHCKYDVKEINASDDRSATNLIEKIQNYSTHQTIKEGNKPSLICLDEIDGVTQNQSNGIKVILDYLQFGQKKKKEKNEKEDGKGIYKKNKEDDEEQTQKNAKAKNNRPVIFVCNDPFSRGLKELRQRAHVFYFNPLNPEKVVKRLKQICDREKVYIESEVLQKICLICHNDIRSCVGLLQLVCREKRTLGRNPKEIISKMKISFIKDNEANLNEFMSSILYKPKIVDDKKIKDISTEIYQIGNPSLLIESMLQNMLYNKQMYHQFHTVAPLYENLVKSDFLLKNSFKYRNQLDIFHHLPYTYYYITYRNQESKRIQFPLSYFQKIKKLNTSKDILGSVFTNIPLSIRTFLKKRDLVGPYLLSLLLSMQAPSSKQIEVVKCVSVMVTYGFSINKDQYLLFDPPLDSLLTYGKKQPEILLSNTTKVLMEDNYTFIKMRKDLVGANNDVKDTTEMLMKQMNLQTRKRRKNQQQFQYKFQEGTGTKISFPLTFKHFV